MKLGWQPKKWLEKKAKAGLHGYPAATVAFYGPDDRRASKVAVGIFPTADSEVDELRRWFAESGDLRKDAAILSEVGTFPARAWRSLRDDDGRYFRMPS
jgi:hypothetical protein